MTSLVHEIRERLTALVKGEGDVRETARWAADVMEAGDPVWRDEAEWRVLEKLATAADPAADPAAGTEYAYGPDDFRDWLREFTEACPRDEPPEA